MAYGVVHVPPPPPPPSYDDIGPYTNIQGLIAARSCPPLLVSRESLPSTGSDLLWFGSRPNALFW